MINSFKNPAIMRILRTTERHGAGWREQNFIPNDEAAGLIAGAQGRITVYTRDSADSLHQITTGLQQRKPWKCTD